MSTEPSVSRISPKLQSKIVENVTLNRLTIIVGPTGCGKSTQVPALLLDRLVEDPRPILCTQPRRLAVVAVATRVASERGSGEEVGFHIGNSNLSSSKTKLLFTTAGILLADLRSNGPKALTKFKCVVLDECHERSAESDLVLAIVKSFLQVNTNTSVVLMSATFDYQRYITYFASVCEQCNVLTLETANSFESWYSQVEVFYLEQAMQLLLESSDNPTISESFYNTMRSNANDDLVSGESKGKTLSEGLLEFVRELVMLLHLQEDFEVADNRNTFIIFAPTYQHLEQLYDILLQEEETGCVLYDLNVLHSSVDIDHCLRTMSNDCDQGSLKKSGKDAKETRRRKIILASAIADSSVTIPGVSCVIDLCRALQVQWNMWERKPIPKTVWASKSICEQRKGRTGRTCRGRVFRLVPERFYNFELEEWDIPHLPLSSCQNEVLALLCSSHKNMSNPSGFLKKCLDPPPPDVVEDSISYLTEIGACFEDTGRSDSLLFRTPIPKAEKKLLPTMFGRLMASIPFSVADAKLILAGAQVGLLYETIALRAILSHRPAPIVHYFRESAKTDLNLMKYDSCVKNGDLISIALANLSAYMYWDANFNSAQCMLARRWFTRYSGGGAENLPLEAHLDPTRADCGVWQWTPKADEIHAKWCEKQGINPTSVKDISKAIHNTINVLFHSQYEPDWLKCCSSTPRWRHRAKWQGSDREEHHMLWRVYGDEQTPLLIKILRSICQENGLTATALSYAHKLAGAAPSSNGFARKPNEGPVACLHFLSGNCTFGGKCRNSHELGALRPPCRFFAAGNCSKGESCLYSHVDADETEQLEVGQLKALIPILPESEWFHGSALEWFCSFGTDLLLLGEGTTFPFTRSLCALGIFPAMSTTDADVTPSLQTPTLTKVNATRLNRDERIVHLVTTGTVCNFAWIFPFVGGAEEDEETTNENFLSGTFLSITALLSDMPRDTKFTFGLSLHSNQFSRWSILRSALRTGWTMTYWGPFDQKDFPNYQPHRSNGKPLQVSSPRFYLFEYKAGHVV